VALLRDPDPDLRGGDDGQHVDQHLLRGQIDEEYDGMVGQEEERTETAKIDVELIYKTEEAVLVSEGQVEGWVPKSLIVEPDREEMVWGQLDDLGERLI